MMRMDIARSGEEVDCVTGWRRVFTSFRRPGRCASIKRTIRRRGRRMSHQIEQAELLEVVGMYGWNDDYYDDWWGEEWDDAEDARCPHCGGFHFPAIGTNLGQVLLEAAKEAA